MKNKFNIIDLIIGIFLVAVVVFLVQKFSHTSVIKNENSNATDVIFTLKVNEIIDITAETLPADGQLFDDEGNLLGQVVNKTKSNAEVTEIKGDGQYVKTTIPDKYDVYLTVESEAVLKDEGYFLYGKKNIGVGSNIKVKAKNIQFEANVVNMSE